MKTNEDSIYDELPEFDWNKYEPKRSRMQIDISKDVRVRLRKYGPAKEIVITSLAKSYPEIADLLLAELKMVRNERYAKRWYNNNQDGNQTKTNNRLERGSNTTD